MSGEKRIPIYYKRTGDTHYSDPVQVQASKHQDIQPTSRAPVRQSAVSGTADTTDVGKGAVVVEGEITAPELGSQGLSCSNSGFESPPSGKPKIEIETLEQFIAHAYGLKGRKVALKSKVQRVIAKNPKLSDEALARLHQLAQEDRMLAVPRQLLLASRDVDGYPGLRAALRNFVSDVLVSHPLFRCSELQAILRNLPDAPSPNQALGLLVDSQLFEEPRNEKSTHKPAELEELRMNAAYALAVWFADTRGISLGKLTEILNAVLWEPKSRELEHDSTRLRVLTDINQMAGVGLACQQFCQQAAKRTEQAERALREAETAKDRLATLKKEVADLRLALSESREEAKQNQIKGQSALDVQHANYETQLAHLRDDLEQLRTRLLRRLVTDIDQLEVGLTALRTPEPRLHVMCDRAERVMDAMRAEINKLKAD